MSFRQCFGVFKGAKRCATTLSHWSCRQHEFFQLLIESGALVNAWSDADGETPLISAVRWDFFAGVRLSIGHGGTIFSEALTEDESPLIPGNLKTMKKLCDGAFEFKAMCICFVERLNRVVITRYRFTKSGDLVVLADGVVLGPATRSFLATLAIERRLGALELTGWHSSCQACTVFEFYTSHVHLPWD